jgi:pimeloyl-ACP methyl ester carboxylesterase
VLVNSIGGSAWSDGRGVIRAIGQRPLWGWGLHLQTDLLATRNLARVLRVILRDAVPNLVRSLGAIWRVANLARAADLTKDLAELNRRRIPMVIVWSREDNVIPEATLMSLRAGDGHRSRRPLLVARRLAGLRRGRHQCARLSRAAR